MKKTVKEIIEMINNNELFYDQTTQRNFIYNDMMTVCNDGAISKSGNVIRSILKEKIQLPALFFWKRKDGKYNIHDGKQRILSIYYFCNYSNKDNIKVITKLGHDREVLFGLLSGKEKEELLNYEFDIVVKEGDSELEEKSFDLINKNSVPLTSYECIRGLCYGRWFEGFENYIIRKGNQIDAVSSKIGRGVDAIYYLLEYFELLTDKLSDVTKEEKLRKLIKLKRDNEFDQNYLKFDKKIEIYSAIWNAMKQNTRSIESCLSIAHFLNEKDWDPSKAIEFYKRGCADSNDIKKWTYDIHKIALNNLYLYNIYVDYNRWFSKNDKASLFHISNKCSYPGCNVDSFDKLEVDHIIPWSQGGKTKLNNGQLLCKTHNTSKGSNDFKTYQKNIEPSLKAKHNVRENNR